MTESELIEEFLYNGCDIRKYKGNIEVVPTNESRLIYGNKLSIGTSRTFSCTNLLIFSNTFAYLVHLLPSEVVGINNNFDNRINEIQKIINHFEPEQINILIATGESIPSKGKANFHDLTNIYIKLKKLEQNNMHINYLPKMKSKYLLYDLENNLLFINNPNKEVINLNNEINNIKTK